MRSPCTGLPFGIAAGGVADVMEGDGCAECRGAGWPVPGEVTFSRTSRRFFSAASQNCHHVDGVACRCGDLPEVRPLGACDQQRTSIDRKAGVSRPVYRERTSASRRLQERPVP